MAAFTCGKFGSGMRLTATGFFALGLITFWIYSVFRIATTLRAHCERRWSEIEARVILTDADTALWEAFRQRGFVVSYTPPKIAAGLFALCAALVLWWFVRWILLGDFFSHDEIVAEIGISSGLFYIATMVVMLWALGTLRRHEISELLVHEIGANAMSSSQSAEPGNEMVHRWEQQSNRIVLFLILALPIVFSPTLGAHLVLSGKEWGHELTLPALCFLLAAVFHIWGTLLLVGLYNDHLAFEAQQLEVLPHPVGDRAVTDAPSDDFDAPRRELVTIMLTDMYGYSKDMERDEARAYAKLLEHNRIMRSMIKAHQGREIKTIGDAFLVIFKSAIDAVDCALAIQRAFSDFNLGKEEESHVLVRIGIHIGDVLITSNDVFGDGVNITARIEPYANPGGICISEPVFAMVRKKLQLEVSMVEGAKLKNIAVPPDLYRIHLGS